MNRPEETLPETLDVVLPVVESDNGRFIVLETLTLEDRVYQGLVPENSIGELLNQVSVGTEPSQGVLWVEKSGNFLLPITEEIIVQLQNLVLLRAQRAFGGCLAAHS